MPQSTISASSIPALTALPAFSDNYIWTLYDHQYCVVIDPGQAAPVSEFLRRSGTRLAGILLTHHHADHIGGVDALLASHAAGNPEQAPLPVIGPLDSRIPQVTRTVNEGDRVSLTDWGLPWQIDFQVLEIPGHTRSHIAFVNQDWLFCGDTLFSAGCGRLFEGTPAQMQDSLDKLAALPAGLLVCCAHEYTLSNCRFALQVEPDNTDLQQRYQQVSELRAQARMTLPVSLANELSYNPFLRSRQASVIQAARQRLRATGQAVSWRSAGDPEPHEVLAVIRSWKDAA